MKLLVLAQTPPPLHGQSRMVQTLLEGLPGRDLALRHVELRVSRDQADIGRARPGKLLPAIRAGLAARRLARSEACDTLYYVPAPGKRSALWRDLVVLGLARPACRRLILHWHASGLGHWLAEHAHPLERRLAHRRLGGADLSIVLSTSLQADAERLRPRRTVIVANGIADPGGAPRLTEAAPGRPRLVFLGALAVEKGVVVLLDAVTRLRAAGTEVDVVLAGSPASAADAAAIHRAAQALGPLVQRPGFLAGEEKARLLSTATVFCLPTFYPHEAQPLVLLEALAHDVPIVATTWRGIPELLPAGNPLVPPQDPAALAEALALVLRRPPAPGANRAHFLAHFTRDQHLERLAAALRSIDF